MTIVPIAMMLVVVFLTMLFASFFSTMFFVSLLAPFFFSSLFRSMFVAVARCIDISVPIVFDEIDRAATSVISGAVVSPMFRMTGRNT
jgi:hypothetical protein